MAILIKNENDNQILITKKLAVAYWNHAINCLGTTIDELDKLEDSDADPVLQLRGQLLEQLNAFREDHGIPKIMY